MFVAEKTHLLCIILLSNFLCFSLIAQEPEIIGIDIQPGEGGSSPINFALASSTGLVIFVAWQPETGAELYSSDGTPDGTNMILDLFPGPTGGVSVVGRENIIPFRGGILFQGVDPEFGESLWFTDGTESGTTMIADFGLSNRNGDGFIIEIFVAENKIYLRVKTEDIGDEFWVVTFPEEDDGGGGGGHNIAGCAIATAAYGTPMAQDLPLLREFRNDHLLNNIVGASIADLYYRVSPFVSDQIGKNPTLASIARVLLRPIVFLITMDLSIAFILVITVFVSILLFLRAFKKMNYAKAY